MPKCLYCGVEIPEGRQICPSCELNPTVLKAENERIRQNNISASAVKVVFDSENEQIARLDNALYLMAAHYGGNNAAQSIVDRFKELATANAANAAKPDVAADKPRKVVAVDFDGTLCTNNYPNIGAPIQQTIRYIKRERLNGSIIVLWTCRQGAQLAAAVDWCERQGLIFDYINENTPQNIAKYGGDTRKICADVYIDDRAAAFNSLLLGDGQPPKQIRNNGGIHNG